MIFAKVVNLNCGYDDGKYLKERGYKLGDKFLVKKVSMGSCHTTIEDESGHRFNSVHFEFFDDEACTKPHDIYRDPHYNPYIN